MESLLLKAASGVFRVRPFLCFSVIFLAYPLFLHVIDFIDVSWRIISLTKVAGCEMIAPKPLLRGNPKTKLPPARKRVTAILGLNYLDGVLMLADTEESLGADAKSESDKLHRFIFPVGAPAKDAGTMITGGAGDAFLIECANQEMERFFQTAISGAEDLVSALDTFANDFFQKTVQPYKGMAPELIPNFEMLIAVNIRPHTSLFHWREGRMLWIRSHTHAAIGSGIVELHPRLRNLQFSPSKECSLFHGVNMMYHAKRAVTGVGGKTVAVALDDDGSTQFFGTEIPAKIEELVINYEQFKIDALDGNVATIYGSNGESNQELEENIDHNFSDLPEAFRKYRQAYKDIFKPPSIFRKSEDQQ